MNIERAIPIEIQSETSTKAIGCGQLTEKWDITTVMPETDQSISKSRPPSTSSQVTSLVSNARDGSIMAFNQLVEIFQEEIYRMAYYRTRSRMDAEDITQDVFMQAFRHLPRLKQTERFRSWLFRIAMNKIRDFYRKKKLRNLFKNFSNDDETIQLDRDSNEDPEAMENLIRQDFWKKFGLVLDKLSRMEREVFLLRFFDHLSIREIAGVLKKSESTIKTHLYRSLKKLKTEPIIRQLREEKTQ